MQDDSWLKPEPGQRVMIRSFRLTDYGVTGVVTKKGQYDATVWVHLDTHDAPKQFHRSHLAPLITLKVTSEY